MEINIQNMSIKYSGNTQKIVDLALKLAYKDVNSVVDFFKTKTNGLPRSFRIRALRTILNDYVKIAKELDLTSELLYRLNWYPQFSEYQLFKFYSTLSNLPVEKFDEDKIVVDYRVNFWTIILVNADKLGLKDNDIKFLLELKESHQPFLEYNSILDSVFYDCEDSIDGLVYDEFRDVLFKSSTIIELREIAAKYQINVPKRLTREQLLTLIIEGLKRNNMYDDALGEKLADYKVISLQRFAKNNNIKASTELKKEEVIDYILNVASESDILIQQQMSFVPIVMSSEEFEMKLEYIKDIDDVEMLERHDVENNNIVTDTNSEMVAADVDKAYVDEQLAKIKKDQEEILEAIRLAEEEKQRQDDLNAEAVNSVEESTVETVVSDVDKAYIDEQLAKIKKEQEEFIEEQNRLKELSLEAIRSAEEEKQKYEELSKNIIENSNTTEPVSNLYEAKENDQYELEKLAAIQNKQVEDEMARIFAEQYESNTEEDEVTNKEFKEEIDRLNSKFDLLLDKLSTAVSNKSECCEKTYDNDRIRELELKIVELTAKQSQPSPVSVIFNYPESKQNDSEATAAMLASAISSQQPTVVNVNNSSNGVCDTVEQEENLDGQTAEEMTEKECLSQDSKIVYEDEHKKKHPVLKFILNTFVFLLIVAVIYAIAVFIILGGVRLNEAGSTGFWSIKADSLAVKIITFDQQAVGEWLTQFIVNPVFDLYGTIVSFFKK